MVDGRGLSLRRANTRKGSTSAARLFDHVTPGHAHLPEEIFGPVLSIVRAPDLRAGAQLVNEHEFGNGTAIFTRDGDTARTFTARVKAGMVGINVPIPVPMAFHSFGGWKRSLFGDHSHARARRRALLHPPEDRHQPLADRRARSAPSSSCRR